MYMANQPHTWLCMAWLLSPQHNFPPYKGARGQLGKAACHGCGMGQKGVGNFLQATVGGGWGRCGGGEWWTHYA